MCQYNLDLSRNHLRGTLSSALGSMRRLQVLQLRANAIAGKLPGELGAAASLQQLDLSDNRLMGPLPVELGRLTAGASTRPLRSSSRAVFVTETH